MTIDKLKEEISSVISVNGCSAEFYFLLDSGEQMIVKSVDIDENDQKELSDLFIGSISKNVLLNDELSLIGLSSADDRKSAIYEYDLEEIPVELTHLKKIIENEQFDAFSFGEDSLTQLEGVLILVGNYEKQLAVYKHHYPVTLLKKDSGFSLMKSRDSNRFQKLDRDILKLDAKFQFIKVSGKHYIVDLKALERFFGFHEAIKNVAEKGIANIKSAGLVQNLEVFEGRLNDITFSRKLVKSSSNSPVLGIIPKSHVIAFSRTHPALKGQFKYSDDGTQFHLKTKKSQNLFLKLLNDDFLQSELTKRYYDSIAKDDVDIEIVSEEGAGRDEVT